MGKNTGYLTADKTEKGDESYTPKYAVMPIIKHLQKNKSISTIWCPFDHEHSQYVRQLRKVGYNVICSHIEDGQDFFKYEPTQYDCIVSNPPFSKGDEVLTRLYELDKPFAMLLPIPYLQSKTRTPLFAKHGLELLVFDKRICYYKNGNLDKVTSGVAFASAYFCHNLLSEKLICEILEEDKNQHYLTD